MYWNKDLLEYKLKTSLKVIRMYDWLLDLYVLDFFINNHWEKLPSSWQNCFLHMDPKDLGDELCGNHTNNVMPLSFLCLINNIKSLSIPREKSNTFNSFIEQNDNVNTDKCSGHPKLKNLFLKHVKLKKRHEVSLMADVVSQTAAKSRCEAVIDFGSGLGHLVRMLAYKNELFAAGIECQTELTKEARKLDLELEYTANKYLSQQAMANLRRPVHFNITLSSIDQLEQLPLPTPIKTYGLIGLHPCGDLGPLLLNYFATSPHVKFICLVGCCYMKLTDQGYPLSKFVQGLDNKLSYASREISCHAIETYCERLRKGQYEDLKIHAYRAALERILVEYDPKLRHAPVRSIKHSDSMTFQKYCHLALERLDIPLPKCERVWSRGVSDLSRWRSVVMLYSLRLALAPLVETVLLLDRMMYVYDHGLSCEILPVFDPCVSPRNHVMIARK